MAATYIDSIHKSEGKSEFFTLKKSLNYIQDEAKTWDGSLVEFYGCSPGMAAEEFECARLEYLSKAARRYPGEILAYHVRQSFLPGEITPEAAMEVGRRLAMELTGGNHAFVLCVHTDRAHIHCQAIFNAVDLDCKWKFDNEWNSHKKVAKISDRICAELGLSVISNPGRGTGAYRPKEERGRSQREILMDCIDKAMQSGPASFDEFLVKMMATDCRVQTRGKAVKYSFLPPLDNFDEGAFVKRNFNHTF